MNTFIITVLFIVLTTGGIKQPMHTLQSYDVAIKDRNLNQQKEDPYQVKFSLEKQSETGYNLIVAMQLNEGAHYISPNSRRTFTGKFKLFIDSKEYLLVDNFLLEDPASVEIYDNHPFVDGYVNWVAQDTQYKKLIHVKTKDDFNVYGFIQFTIEPRCSLEKIPFIIKQRHGKLVVEINVC